ncbi:MAG: GNAT family N-acetyltransferase [Chitinophagaceae bacterium]|nr:GNAT family N-acetyltransferase [Chitinophagaceae bacterium]
MSDMFPLDAGICQLRPLHSMDAVPMTQLAHNRAIWDHVRDYFPHPYQLEHATQFIEMVNAQQPPQNLAIEYQRQFAGVVGFFPLQDVYHQTADFGYWLGEPFWGKGIATAAVAAMVPYIFEHFGIVRLQSGVFHFNPASMRVLEKNGFQLDCIARCAVTKNGRIGHEHRYSLLKPGLSAAIIG